MIDEHVKTVIALVRLLESIRKQTESGKHISGTRKGNVHSHSCYPNTSSMQDYYRSTQGFTHGIV
jgi:hypothetical protein